MTETKKKATVAEAMAAVDDLHKQVVKNQETLNLKLGEFDKDVKATLDQWNKRNARDKETLAGDFEELRLAVNKKHQELSGRIEEIGGVINTFRQTAESSRETTLEIKRSVDTLQQSLATPAAAVEAPELVAVSEITFGTAWKALKKNAWYPWIRFAFFCLLGLAAYHYVLVPLLTKNVAPSILPNILRPNVDPNSPVGAATIEVSREPFRSDTASREAFGRIFDSLDQYVRDGQLTDMEAYYNEFGKRMQQSLDGAKYQQWADLWRRLAVVCHRHGGGDNDLRIFNSNLQAAARVVSGRVSDMPPHYHNHPFAHGSGAGYDPGYGTAAAPTGAAGTPADGQTSLQAPPWPFVPNRSHP